MNSNYRFICLYSYCQNEHNSFAQENESKSIFFVRDVRWTCMNLNSEQVARLFVFDQAQSHMRELNW